MTTENKNKAIPSAASQKLSVHGAERTGFQSLKRPMHISFTPKLITNGYRVV